MTNRAPRAARAAALARPRRRGPQRPRAAGREPEPGRPGPAPRRRRLAPHGREWRRLLHGLPAADRRLGRQHPHRPLRDLGAPRQRERRALRRRLLHGAHRRGQGEPRRLPRGDEVHAREVPDRRRSSKRSTARRCRRRSRRAPRRSPSTASWPSSRSMAPSVSAGALALANAPPHILFSDDPRRPRRHRRHAGLARREGDGAPARHQHEPGPRPHRQRRGRTGRSTCISSTAGCRPIPSPATWTVTTKASVEIVNDLNLVLRTARRFRRGGPARRRAGGPVHQGRRRRRCSPSRCRR